MNHLTANEIIDFVMENKLDDNFFRLASRVNGHIMKCDKCLALVEAYQTVYDELERLDRLSEFEETAEKQLSEKKEIEGLQY